MKTMQAWYDAQIARYAGCSLAEFVVMLDRHAATDYATEDDYLADWVETQWPYWSLERRCQSRQQRASFDDLARSCGFVLIG